MSNLSLIGLAIYFSDSRGHEPADNLYNINQTKRLKNRWITEVDIVGLNDSYVISVQNV